MTKKRREHGARHNDVMLPPAVLDDSTGMLKLPYGAPFRGLAAALERGLDVVSYVGEGFMLEALTNEEAVREAIERHRRALFALHRYREGARINANVVIREARRPAVEYPDAGPQARQMYGHAVDGGFFY